MKGGARVPPYGVVTQQRLCFGQATPLRCLEQQKRARDGAERQRLDGGSGRCTARGADDEAAGGLTQIVMPAIRCHRARPTRPTSRMAEGRKCQFALTPAGASVTLSAPWCPGVTPRVKREDGRASAPAVAAPATVSGELGSTCVTGLRPGKTGPGTDPRARRPAMAERITGRGVPVGSWPPRRRLAVGG